MFAIELRHLSKAFGHVTVCDDIDLTIKQGEFVTLLGPSGCGKTTTLNMIAGLEDCTSGDILMNGRRVNDHSPVQRDVAMVFQNFALYPHMTVAQNIGFTLKMRGLMAGEITKRVARVAEALELGSLLDRLPSRLSGGQQQRVAIGRALVREPRVFLFDEPFSNLDAALRIKMRAEVKELHLRLGVTSIFVTHDQEEAMSISDRIAVMHGGKIEQIGVPEEIYQRPETRYVATFIGSPQIELVPAVVQDTQQGFAARVNTVDIPLRSSAGRLKAGQEVDIGIRPEHVRLGDRGVEAVIRLVQPVGPATHVTLDWEGGTLIASAPGFLRLAVGSPIRAMLDSDHIFIFDRNTGRRIQVGNLSNV